MSNTHVGFFVKFIDGWVWRDQEGNELVFSTKEGAQKVADSMSRLRGGASVFPVKEVTEDV
jgi:hypothetical protein